MTRVSPQAPAVQFDHHEARISESRDDVLREVTQYPVFYTESHGGYWVVTSHELAKRVLRDPATFSSHKHEDGSGGVTIPTMIGPRLVPAEVDPPFHRTLRRILSAKFTRSSVEKLRPAMTRLVSAAIDNAVQQGGFDIVRDISNVIPAGSIVEYLGFPDSEREAFIKSVQAALDVMPHASDPEWTDRPEMLEGMTSFQHALETIQALISERKATQADDLVGYMVSTDHELTGEDIVWLTFTLLVGGAENPAAMISNALLHLAQDEALRRRLIANPDLIGPATEELLRRITPGVSLARNVTTDVELDGVQIHAGDRILVWLPGPNHDPTVFDSPYTIDVDRANCPHLAFGDGPHVCPGATFFRVQFEILIKEILTRIPNYSIDLDQCERFEDSATMWGFRTMPAHTNL